MLKLYQIAGEVGMTNEHEELPLKVFHSFSPALQESPLGKEFLTTTTITLNAKKLSEAGEPVQEFSVLTDSGKLFNTASLEGSPYVIGFSATWCIPCQYHQATLLTLYHKYRPQGLKVVYFNMDINVKLWQDLIKNKKLDWINVSERTLVEESKLAKQFNIHGYPTYIVVNRKGKIVYNTQEVNPNPSQIQNDNFSHLEEYINQAL